MKEIIEGIAHITDYEGYDHMLFLAALSAPFGYQHLKSLLLLITAFTVGHSVTLALSALDVIHFSSFWVELIISASIAATALFNLFIKSNKVTFIRYFFVFIFGLIHGMGFSSYFKMMVSHGNESFISKLFSFNVGVEIGQLIILAAILILGVIFQKIIKLSSKNWSTFLSLFCLIVSSYLIIGKF